MAFVRIMQFDGSEIYEYPMRSGTVCTLQKLGLFKWKWSVDFTKAHIRQIIDDVPLEGTTWLKLLAEDKCFRAWAKASGLKRRRF